MPIPSTEELVLSVKLFLERDVIPSLEHRTAFHARVAANVLGIVARDIAGQPELTERDVWHSLLDAPADDPVAAVCARIRSGDMTEKTPDLLPGLLRAAMARVAADNPKYSTYQRMLAEGGNKQPSI